MYLSCAKVSNVKRLIDSAVIELHGCRNYDKKEPEKSCDDIEEEQPAQEEEVRRDARPEPSLNSKHSQCKQLLQSQKRNVLSDFHLRFLALCP